MLRYVLRIHFVHNEIVSFVHLTTKMHTSNGNNNINNGTTKVCDSYTCHQFHITTLLFHKCLFCEYLL